LRIKFPNILSSIFIIVILITFTENLSAQENRKEYSVSVNKILMGTTVETTVRSPDINEAKEALLKAYKEMQRVENLLSSHKEGSEITFINNFAGIHPVKVSLETLLILKNAINYSQHSKGLFDVTIGSVSNLWGFSDENRTIELPDSSQIDSALKYVNYRNIIINPKDTTVLLKNKGMRLDLGGIAKGYAIDRGSAVLKNLGISNFILNAGGDIYVSGMKEKNTEWKIGIQAPRDSKKIDAAFNLKNYAVATSGDYERFRIINGVRYHHILNPFNGYPGRLSESCTVLAPTAEEADALATFLFLKGANKALADKSIKIPFLIITTKGKIFYNSIFNGKYKPEIM